MKKISASRTILTSFFADIFEFIINLTATVLTGSITMLAETLQTTAYLLSDIFLLIGLKKSKRKPNKKHPFGYGREIYLWTMFSSMIMLFLMAGFSIYLGLERFLNPENIFNINLALIILLIIAISNTYSFSVGFRRIFNNDLSNLLKRFKESPEVETKTTMVSDFMGILAALIGFVSFLVFKLTGNLHVDGIGAILVGLVMVFLAIYIFMETKSLLIGQGVSDEIKEKIEKATMSVSEIDKVLDIKAINIGVDKIMVNIEVHIKNDLNTDSIEDVIDKVEKKIIEKVPNIKYIQIEPERPN